MSLGASAAFFLPFLPSLSALISHNQEFNSSSNKHLLSACEVCARHTPGASNTALNKMEKSPACRGSRCKGPEAASYLICKEQQGSRVAGRSERGELGETRAGADGQSLRDHAETWIFTPSKVGAIEDSEQRRNRKPENRGGAGCKEAPCPQSHGLIGQKDLQGFPLSFFHQWRLFLPPHPGFHHRLLLRDPGPSVSPLCWVVFSGWHLSSA